MINKIYKHWIGFDTFKIDKVQQFLNDGSNFSVINIYEHPSKMCYYIAEVESTDNYSNLDLNVNDGYGILHHYGKKPKVGSEPITQKFVEVYGNLPKMNLN